MASSKRRRFSAQFKAEAVQLVLQDDRPIVEVVRRGRRSIAGERDGIPAVATPGMAPAEAPDGQPGAVARPVDLEGLGGVG